MLLEICMRFLVGVRPYNILGAVAVVEWEAKCRALIRRLLEGPQNID